MEISPPARYKPRPYALLYPGHRVLVVLSEEGERRYEGKRSIETALQRLSGHVLYVHASLEKLKHTTGALSWKMTTWKGRQVGMVHLPSGARVCSLRQTLIDSRDPYGDLSAVMRWLSGYGVAPASISGMAWGLFRASLSGSIRIGADPELGRSAFYGGRQQITAPRRFQHYQAVDITAAYPHAMATRDYALSLRQVDASTRLDPEEPGIARATVLVPMSLPYAPLPIRIDAEVIHFPHGAITGTWAWTELAAAADLGCEVKVHESYAPRRRADLFSTWWLMAQTGRWLPGEAARLAKAVSNSTWGQFAMGGGERTEIGWADQAGLEPYEVHLDARTMPHQWMVHVAAETTARVRRRMLLEGLYGETTPPVHVDTDGILIRQSSPLPANSGDGFGQWRQKERMQELDLRAPQLYRFLCGPLCGTEHPAWHHVASGMSKPYAEAYFSRQGHIKTTVAYFGDPDLVLPAGHVSDLAQIEKMSREARALAG